MANALALDYCLPQQAGSSCIMRQGIAYSSYDCCINPSDASRIVQQAIKMYMAGNREERLAFSDGRLEIRATTDVIFAGAQVQQNFHAKLSTKSMDANLEIVVTEKINAKLN